MRIPSLAATALSLSQLCQSASIATRDDDSITISATPHDSYSSSIGVLGCKINTNRVAYWPQSVDCNNICVSLEYEDRQVYLLRIDQSQGAYDVSYDAWNYLYTGYSATKKPTSGGGVTMQYRNVPASNCNDLIRTKGNKLPLSASNSMNFLASCLAQPKSWVAKNNVLYNILDSICTLGTDEQCSLDWPDANQPSCKHPLGVPSELTNCPVYNIQYPSGKEALAGAKPATGTSGSGTDDENAGVRSTPSLTIMLLALTLLWLPGSNALNFI